MTPPLAGDVRSRHKSSTIEDDNRLRWRGLGRTAFFASFGDLAGDAEPGEPFVIRDLSILDARLRNSDGPGQLHGDASSVFARRRSIQSVRSYFAGGATEAVLFNEPRLTSGVPHWIGEDSGPGHGTGLFRLLESVDASTVVLPFLSGLERQRRVREAARMRPDKLFLLEGRCDDVSDSGGQSVPAGAFWFLEPNAVLFDAADPDKVNLGSLAACLEATDFPSEFGPAMRAAWAGEPLEAIVVWRCAEAIRRSIELGTRWLVFESSDPGVCRRVEREVLAFFQRLARHGIVDPRLDGLRVECRLARRAGDEPERSMVAVDIEIDMPNSAADGRYKGRIRRAV